MPLPIALGMPSGIEWLFLMGIALLIWGKKLPEVARNMGRGVVEFKKGLAGIEDEIETSSKTLPSPKPAQPEYKFDPYTGKPIDQNTAG